MRQRDLRDVAPSLESYKLLPRNQDVTMRLSLALPLLALAWNAAAAPAAKLPGKSEVSIA